MTNPSSQIATDRKDERLIQRTGLRGAIDSGIDRVRGGDLGVLPVIGGVALIWTVFQIINPVFLSSRNLTNMLLQMSFGGVIALGMVCVLLVGEIDLSVGSVSGLSAAVVAVLSVRIGIPTALAIVLTILTGVLIGAFYSLVYNRFGVPSFVVTLAGLLGFYGLQLSTLGVSGTINLPDTHFLPRFAMFSFVPAWLSYLLIVLAVAAYAVSQIINSRRRAAAGLSARGMAQILITAAVMIVAFTVIAWYLNLDRGIGWMPVFFFVLVVIMHYLLKRTKWGRSVYAVGGNREAARRAGINVKRVYLSVFIVCSSFAAIGGMLSAGRLAAASQQSGTGDVNLNAIAAAVIGGTSLFGGRGRAAAALLGVIVIQSIASGLNLMSLDSSYRYAVTGVVLLLAVVLDSVSNRSRASHGRA